MAQGEGAWRVLLLLIPGTHLDIKELNQIDNSAIVTACIIIAVVLFQVEF